MKRIESDSPPHALTPLDVTTFRLEELPRKLRRAFDVAMKEQGLNRNQWRLLAHVRRQAGLTQIELSRSLEVDPVSVGAAIDALVQRGLVERKVHAGDRRAWKIFPTADAMTLLGSMRETVDDIYRQLFDGFSDSEIKQLSCFLERMADNMST